MKITNYERNDAETPVGEENCERWLEDHMGHIFVGKNYDASVSILARTIGEKFDLISLDDGNRYYEGSNKSLVSEIFEAWIKLPKLKSVTLDYGDKKE